MYLPFYFFYYLLLECANLGRAYMPGIDIVSPPVKKLSNLISLWTSYARIEDPRYGYIKVVFSQIFFPIIVTTLFHLIYLWWFGHPNYLLRFMFFSLDGPSTKSTIIKHLLSFIHCLLFVKREYKLSVDARYMEQTIS